MNKILILHGDTPAGQAAIQAARKRKLKVFAVSRSPVAGKSKGIQWFNLDTSDHNHVERLAARLDSSGIKIDILVTCPFSVFASDDMTAYPFEQMPFDLWDLIIRNNLSASMLFCKVFGKRMSECRNGRIIQLVSNVSIDPHNPKHFEKGYPSAAYAAVMGGVQALSRHLAAQYQDNGVLINNIIYGPLFESEPRYLAEAYKKKVPLGRIMTVKDLANTIDLLLDPDSSYITGQNIVADGGASIW